MLSAPRLIAITDTCVRGPTELLACAERLCRSCRPGSVIIQLRDRHLGVIERMSIGCSLASITNSYSQQLSVNDRVDLALALGAHGVHLGEASAPATRVRSSFGERFWITRASHDVDSCQALGADAVLLSPICSPRKGAPSLGLEALARACGQSDALLYALGGVSAENAKACIEAGATGVAVIGAWLACESQQPLIDALRIARST